MKFIMKVSSKIINTLILFSLIILIIGSTVNAAASYDVDLVVNNTTVQSGQQIEVTIKVQDIVDISGGVAGLSAKLEYDTTKLEKVGEGEALNGFMLVEGDTIELAKYPGVTNDTELAKFTFKAKDSATGDAEIFLSGIEVVNGSDTFSLEKKPTTTISITSSSTSNGASGSNAGGNSATTNDGEKNTSTSGEDKANTTNDEGKSTSGNTAKSSNSGKQTTTSSSTNDNTKSPSELPKTGAGTLILSALGLVAVIALISFVKAKRIPKIK